MKRFAPRELVALDPRAWGLFFDVPRIPENERRGGAMVVAVRGPLMHHADPWGDSYDAIKGRVLAALAEKPSAIVLAIDSPGGLVSGCFDTADEIRVACLEAGVPLYAFVDGQATSAAYALACAAERIVIPSTGIVGSIGVYEMMVDATAQDEKFGVKARIVASGARKADGNPHQPISDEAVAATGRLVLAQSAVFFEHVARSRPMTADDVRALEGGFVAGAAAVPMLADEIATFDEMLAAIGAGTFGAVTTTEPEGKGTTMKTKASKAYEEAIAALRKCAEGDDDESKKAKRMLQAELAGDDKPDEAEGKAGDDKPDAKADDGPDDKPEDKKDGEAKALASRALEEAQRASAATEKLERDQLIASRPDLDETTRGLLAKAPIADVREFIAKHPRSKPKAAATAVVGATRAEGQVDDVPAASEQKRALDVQMGLASAHVEPRAEGNRQVFPAMTRPQRAAWLEKRAKAEADRAKAQGGAARTTA